jgi:hypothetical protein
MLGRSEFDPPAKLFDVSLTFNPRPLEDYLHNVGKDMLKFSRQIATLMDDVKVIRGTLHGFQTDTTETLDRLNKVASAHEAQLRTVQQQSTQTVGTAQFNTTVGQLREQVKTLEVQVAKIEGPNSKRTLEVFEKMVEDWVGQWSKVTLQRDLDTREQRAQEFARHQIERETSNVTTQLNTAIAAVRKEMTERASIEQFRHFSDQMKDRQMTEKERVDERLSAADAEQEKHRQHIADAIRAMDARIGTMHANIAPFFEYDPANPSPAVAQQQRPGGAVPSAPVATTKPVAVLTPETVPVTTVAMERVVDLAAALDGNPQGPQTLHLMKSPAFVLFRQQVLEEVQARLVAARRVQVKESEALFQGVNHDLRQRTTPERVIEIIRQQQDTQTPVLIASLQARVAEIDRAKVAREEMHEGLRAKGDAHTVEQKADKVKVQEAVSACNARCEALERAFAMHQSEREEFRDVLKDVVYTHRRQQVTSGVVSAASVGGAMTSPLGRSGSRTTGAVGASPAVPGGGPVMRSGGVDSSLSLPAISSPRQPLNMVPYPPGALDSTAIVDPRPTGRQSQPTSNDATDARGSRASGRISKQASVVSLPPNQDVAARGDDTIDFVRRRDAVPPASSGGATPGQATAMPSVAVPTPLPVAAAARTASRVTSRSQATVKWPL